MKNAAQLILMVVSLLALLGASAEARTIRATEMSSAAWANLGQGDLANTIVEFHQGDELPMTFSAQGDLLETTQAGTSLIAVKKNFWLQAQNNQILISFDGTNYKNISQALSGSLEAGANPDPNSGVASAINMTLKAYLK